MLQVVVEDLLAERGVVVTYETILLAIPETTVHSVTPLTSFKNAPITDTLIRVSRKRPR